MSAPSLKNLLLSACAGAALLCGAVGAAQAATTTDYGGGSSLIATVIGYLFNVETQVNDPAIAFSYTSDGSGQGQNGFLNNDPSQHSLPVGTTIAFGASDATLSAAQITAWNNSTGSSSSTSGVGKAQGGPLIQVPSVGTPITIPFRYTGHATNGSLQFTDDQLCGIFSSKITLWSDPLLSGVITSGVGTLTGTINVAVRSDSSGTTFLLTQHLAAVCNSTNSNATWLSHLAATKTFQATLFPGGLPANFTAVSGSSGVQGQVAGTNKSIGYLSPDYTLIASANTATPGFPAVAQVKGQDGNYYLPSVSNTSNALGTAAVPTDPTNPAQYVPAVPKPSTGYPIVGYTTLEMAQCYANSNVGTGMYEFLNNLYTQPAMASLIVQNGFVPLQGTPLANYIVDHLVNGDSADVPPLDIQDPNVCQSAGASGPGTYVGR